MKTLLEFNSLRGGYAIDDDLTVQFINTLLYKTDIKDFTNANGFTELHKTFPEKYRYWITDSEYNSVQGLDNYNYQTVTNGTSESFVMFMLRYSSYKKFKFFRGDFIMHKIASNIAGVKWSWIDTADEVESDDAVIISCPFSDFGCEHPEMDKLFERCNSLGVPVLVDMAYYGMCDNINIDLEQDCIDDVVFSLGKTFPIINFRAGVRFSKYDVDDPVAFANTHGIINSVGAFVGSKLLEHFGADYIPSKYRSIANEVCSDLKVEPTKCVIFGSSNRRIHSELNRGNKFTRVCLSTLIRDKYDRQSSN